MVNQQIAALARGLAAGDLAAAPALLDRLAEADDWRHPYVYQLLGELMEWARYVATLPVLPADAMAALTLDPGTVLTLDPAQGQESPQDEDPQDYRSDLERGQAWLQFRRRFVPLFWPELADGPISHQLAWAARVLRTADTARRIEADIAAGEIGPDDSLS